MKRKKAKRLFILFLLFFIVGAGFFVFKNLSFFDFFQKKEVLYQIATKFGMVEKEKMSIQLPLDIEKIVRYDDNLILAYNHTKVDKATYIMAFYSITEEVNEKNEFILTTLEKTLKYNGQLDEIDSTYINKPYTMKLKPVSISDQHIDGAVEGQVVIQMTNENHELYEQYNNKSYNYYGIVSTSDLSDYYGKDYRNMNVAIIVLNLTEKNEDFKARYKSFNDSFNTFKTITKEEK